MHKRNFNIFTQVCDTMQKSKYIFTRKKEQKKTCKRSVSYLENHSRRTEKKHTEIYNTYIFSISSNGRTSDDDDMADHDLQTDFDYFKSVEYLFLFFCIYFYFYFVVSFHEPVKINANSYFIFCFL